MPSPAPRRRLPNTERALLIAALRHADRTSLTLDQISAALYDALEHEWDAELFNRVFGLLRRRFDEESALPLFMAAHRLHIPLPEDLHSPEVT